MNLICFEANEISTAGIDGARQATISPKCVIAAMEKLGFVDYISEVQAAYDECAQQPKKKKMKKSNCSGLTPEQLLAEQNRLFAASRELLSQSSGNSGDIVA
eukprot:SAG31_NODE_2741_length_5156_cov_3.138817_7_plen_102_part_00